jgi:SAM-dependent methyltransferase
VSALPPCPACGAGLRRWRTATASDSRAPRPRYELARCGGCGTAVTLDPPSPEEAAALYEGGAYSTPPGAIDALIEPLRRLGETDRMRALRGLPAGARVLELGAGDGRFVARMRAAGLDARGVEPSPSARARARERGIELRVAAPWEADPASGRRTARPPEDAIVIWHVLEHLPDPVATLGHARQALGSGGRLVVAVPNLASLQAHLGGDCWFHQDVPRHRLHLTPVGLIAMFARAGLSRPRLRHLLVEQNPLGMWQTLLNRLTLRRDVAFGLVKRSLPPAHGRARLDPAVTALAALPLAAVAPALELAAGLMRHGGTIVAVSDRSCG